MEIRSQDWAGRIVAVWLGAVMLVAGAGCGYQFPGDSPLFPKDIQTVYIEPFVSRTRNVGLDRELTSAFRSEFYRRGPLKVVDQLEQADAIISGVIRSFETHVASVNRKDEALQYESTMVLDVSLRRREPNEILWRSQGTRLTQVYSGSRAAVVTTSSEFRTGTFNADDVRRMTDIQLTESDKERARDQLITGFAHDLHQRMVEMF